MEATVQYIQPAILETNNFEIICYLKALGYQHYDHMGSNGNKPYYEEDDDNYIFFTMPQAIGSPKYISYNYQEGKPTLKGSIDCGNNENLFLDLICLRSDSDRWQRFILDKDVTLGDDCVNHLPKGATVICTFDNCKWNHVMHKMTTEELVEFWKTDENNSANRLLFNRITMLSDKDKARILQLKGKV